MTTEQKTDKKDKPKDFLSVAELAEETGLRWSTIKSWSDVALLPYLQAGRGLRKRYPREQALARVKEIQELKKQGKKIEDIVRIFLSASRQSSGGEVSSPENTRNN